MERIKSILLYAGIDEDTNSKYKEYVLMQDVNNLKKYLIFAGALYLILGIAGAISSGFAQRNTWIYLITALLFGVIFVASQLTVKHFGKATNVNRVYIYLFMTLLYVEAIVLTVMHKDQPAVTFIGVLLILPLLFAQYPLPMILFQGGIVVIFCICSSYFKYPEIASIDVWNGITFFIVSIIEIILITPMRFNQIIQPEIIRELSEKDMLTGLKNRNSFERYCCEVCQTDTNIVCIYADANGLHELNNEYGHEAGDNMLKAVASVMMDHFGADNVYRVGGDEFVAFSSGVDDAQIVSHMHDTKKELDQKGYHLSIGHSGPESSSEGVHALIKKAEVSMYEDKKAYYSSAERNRRGR